LELVGLIPKDKVLRPPNETKVRHRHDIDIDIIKLPQGKKENHIQNKNTVPVCLDILM
jgi:hypothetical protein